MADKVTLVVDVKTAPTVPIVGQVGISLSNHQLSFLGKMFAIAHYSPVDLFHVAIELGSPIAEHQRHTSCGNP